MQGQVLGGAGLFLSQPADGSAALIVVSAASSDAVFFLLAKVIARYGLENAVDGYSDRDCVHLPSARCADWTGWLTSSRSFSVTILVRM
jgi:hypothetical protein